MIFKTKACSSVKGKIKIPGDKSISHRSLIFSAIAEGKSTIHGMLESEDCLNTKKAFQAMGVDIQKADKGTYHVEGVGLHGLKAADNVIDCGNSGTTMRLLSGLLAAQDFLTVLTGDSSLRKRPMDRIMIPLSSMGAQIWARNDIHAPLAIKGQELKGIEYVQEVASAQVKSAIILAGLYSEGNTRVIEPASSRDHTERMLSSFGLDLKIDNNIIELQKDREIRLTAQEITVPGDISSAAFMIAAALIVKDSDLIIENVGVNHTRDGILRVLEDMEANIELFNKRSSGGEEVADIRVTSSELKATTIEGDIIPSLIDEIPLIAVLSTQAEGKTIIRDAHELRVKESDRVKTTCDGLRKLGVDVEELEDGMIINGPVKLEADNVSIETYHDHRIAMSFAIAGLITDGVIDIKNAESINTSFPEFPNLLNEISK
ncbi:3-phosphoshikimate 1-carboxyvinyltransferase [Natronospora cellulosivora (SeqCode)]